MKLEMDVQAIYAGIDFESGTQFFMARMTNGVDEGEDVPIPQETYNRLLQEYLKTIGMSQSKPVAKPSPAPSEEPAGDDDEGVTVQRTSQPRKARPAVAKDDDGFEPLPAQGKE
ncbi:MAG: hypothetical protein GYA36_19365 [Veillonellaceae bacterium]|nr:hypothetical protein [Veillonellaceae bacterium]